MMEKNNEINNFEDNEIITINVTEDGIGKRLDKIVFDVVSGSYSRTQVQRLIETGLVLVNKEEKSSNYRCRKDDLIEVTEPEPENYDVIPVNLNLDIVYEDNCVAVVNKPAGLTVHPGNTIKDATLVHGLMYQIKDLSGIGGVMRPGIVHRIDKDTSGLLIVAKNDLAHSNLALQIKEHSFTREYEAVVFGNLKDDSGIVDAPIGRNPKDRKKMCVTLKNSKNALTHYSVITRYKGYTHIRCKLETGRTHQIRVHMAYIGHPVSGDEVYGVKNEKLSFSGQCLHAKKIGFIHPFTKKYLEFDSPLPDYFEQYLQKLNNISK